MPRLTPEQCRAARGLLDWTQEELAARADVSRSTIRDFENGRHSVHAATATQLVAALEQGGALLIPPDEAGPGVRLRKAGPRAFSGEVETGSPSENATNKDRLERFAIPSKRKPL